MSFTFRDFTPRLMAPARGGIPAQWEPVAAVVQRANEWLASSGLRALNVETLLLPLAKTAQPLPSSAGNLERWDEDHQWVQVVRVWVEASAPSSLPPPLPADSPANTAL